MEAVRHLPLLDGKTCAGVILRTVNSELLCEEPVFTREHPLLEFRIFEDDVPAA